MGSGNIGRFEYEDREDLECRTRFIFSQAEEVTAEVCDALLACLGAGVEVVSRDDESLSVHQIEDCAVKLSYSERQAEIEVYNGDLNKRNISINKLEEIFS